MAKKSDTSRRPKKECCLDRPRCKRCPLRALAEGTLPPGYTVRRRRLVRVDAPAAERSPDTVVTGTHAEKGSGKKGKGKKASGKKGSGTTSSPGGWWTSPR